MGMIRKIHLGLGMALVTLFGSAAGCVSADVDEGSVDEATLAQVGPLPPPIPPPIQIDPMPPVPLGGIAICTVSGPTPTGRQWAALMPTRVPGFASRLRLGGVAPTYIRSCYEIARELGLQPVD